MVPALRFFSLRSHLPRPAPFTGCFFGSQISRSILRRTLGIDFWQLYIQQGIDHTVRRIQCDSLWCFFYQSRLDINRLR